MPAPNNQPFADGEWIERIRSGDRAAFEALFRTYGEELCDFALYHVKFPQVSEDLVQDIFCDIWDRRRVWSPQGTIKSYLYRAARNKSLNWLKHRRIERRWETEEKRRERLSRENPDDDAQYRELRQAMQQAVEDLPERRRLVYKMAREGGKSYAEIASALDISPKTVENQMGRALKFLRKRLSAFRSVLL